MKGVYIECDYCGCIEKSCTTTNLESFYASSTEDGWILHNGYEFCCEECYQYWLEDVE